MTTARSAEVGKRGTSRTCNAGHPAGKIRLIDIADETGFSLATVSKVVNGRADVAEETRTIVNAALEKHGYVKRGNVDDRQQLIEVVFQDFDTLWALEVLRGVLDEAKQHNLSVVTTESGDRQHPDSSWVDALLKRRPIGAILIFSDLTTIEKEKLESQHIPYVIFDPSGDPTESKYSVQADNWTGGVIATRHLLALGHTKIAIINGPDEMMCSRARFDGYCAALKEHGIVPPDHYITEGDYTTPGGYAQAVELLALPDRPTAIFAGSDLQAMGVYEAARQLGLRIPEDVSVVGFDDVQTSAYLGPALTTVRQPLQEMAACATRLVLDASEHNLEQKHIILPTNLVVRNSTQAVANQEN
ncbi:LacI family DNA-binding transcriptional regulator [Bifidobacterium choloepi]|uniref:LacI family transcriptional regulator n=1 Tax=Bifidobacterium choloepi TaxID=2614131 RepID=A0A6I5N091_9BIFI|nr:LacI family DNA-binding transcriptional regulator [Bifidobacterium choloepi]NEG69535.1 LacI family transcriptional regulator [Bifidobacterium choloepi]